MLVLVSIILGFHHYFHGKLSRQDLDKISMTRPIVVIHRSFHEFILNSSALVYFGITKELVNNFDEEAKEYANFVTERSGGNRAVAEACLHIMQEFFEPYNPKKMPSDQLNLGEWTV